MQIHYPSITQFQSNRNNLSWTHPVHIQHFFKMSFFFFSKWFFKGFLETGCYIAKFVLNFLIILINYHLTSNVLQGIWWGMIIGVALQTVTLIILTMRTNWNKEVINLYIPVPCSLLHPTSVHWKNWASKSMWLCRLIKLWIAWRGPRRKTL